MSYPNFSEMYWLPPPQRGTIPHNTGLTSRYRFRGAVIGQ